MKIMPIVTTNGSDASTLLRRKGSATVSALLNTLQA
jgi:hypothetical protein